jgi:3-isopropylmalate/(R)-2-methylmalate dehydratase small subunit
MEPFTIHRGIAAPLPLINVNTDMIIPAAFCTNPTRVGLGEGLFYNQRYDVDGRPVTDFVLNRAPYSRATILIGGENFGCGSSREQAPWALGDFGIRCVIAPDFANIFFENCANNGLLAIRLPASDVDRLMRLVQHPDTAELTIDLPGQCIDGPGGVHLAFEIDPALKEQLLTGLDSIGTTLESEADIASYEHRDRQERPWLYASSKGGEFVSPVRRAPSSALLN